MKQPKNVSYLIAGIVLPDEDLRELCAKHLVFARTAEGFTGGSFLTQINWEIGTGAIGVKFAPSHVSADDFACDILNEIPILVIEHIGQSPIYVKPDVFKNICYHVSSIEILGATGSTKLLDLLIRQGFEQIQSTEISCVGIRGRAV